MSPENDDDYNLKANYSEENVRDDEPDVKEEIDDGVGAWALNN